MMASGFMTGLSLFIVFISHLSAILAAEECSWLIDETAVDDPLAKVDVVHGHKAGDDLTSLFRQSDVLNLATEKSLSSFPYFIRLQVMCFQKLSPMVGRHMAIIGLAPSITVTYDRSNSTDNHMGSIENKFTGALVELNRTACINSLCNPAWLAPLPNGNGSNLVNVWVEVEGLEDLFKPQSHTIHLQQFCPDVSTQHNPILFSDLGTEKSPAEMADTLMAGGVLAVKTVPGGVSTFGLAGFQGESTILLSTDDFENSKIIEVPNSMFSGFTLVCSGAVKQVDIISLIHGAVIHHSQYGLFTITNITDITLERILPRCIKKVQTPTQQFLVTQYIMALGTGLDEGNIYIAHVTRKGDLTEFEELLDAENRTLCTVLAPSASCNVVDIAMEGVEKEAFIVLAETDSPSDGKQYHVVHISLAGDSNNTKQWQVVSSTPAKLPIAPMTDYTMLLNSESNSGGRSLTLTGCALASFITKHLYMWGNMLIHSPDDGESLNVLNGFPGSSNITVFITGRDGEMAFLTDTQEVWRGHVGSSYLLKIYPSSAYDTVMAGSDTQGSNIEKSNKTILTIFYTVDGDLAMVLAGNTDNGMEVKRHILPVYQILAHDQFRLASSLLFRNDVHRNDTEEATSLVITQHCSAVKILFYTPAPQQYTRTEKYFWRPPRISDSLKIHHNTSLLAYQVVVNRLLRDRDRHYGHLDKFKNTVLEWKHEKQQSKQGQAYDELLYRFQLLNDEVHINIHDFNKLYKLDQTLDPFPVTIFLGKNENYSFVMDLSIQTSRSVETSKLTYDIDQLHVSVDVSDSTLLNVKLEKTLFYINDSVRLKIDVADSGVHSDQHFPGVNLNPTSMNIKVWNSEHRCFTDNAGKLKQEGLYSASVLLGCPPSQYLRFDVNASLAKHSTVLETPYDCAVADPELPCFYYANGFYPYFSVVDKVMGKSWRFTGRYILKIVGGSEYSKEDIKVFTEEEAEMFSKKVGDTNALVWVPKLESKDVHNGYDVYNSEWNAVSWMCQPQSPCYNVKPSFPNAPEYYFLIELSNKGVDNSTNCDFTMRFIVHVHGLPIASIHMSMYIVLASILVVCSYVVIYHFLMRHDRLLYYQLKMCLTRGKKVVPVLKEEKHTPDFGEPSMRLVPTDSFVVTTRSHVDDQPITNLERSPELSHDDHPVIKQERLTLGRPTLPGIEAPHLDDYDTVTEELESDTKFEGKQETSTRYRKVLPKADEPSAYE